MSAPLRLGQNYAPLRSQIVIGCLITEVHMHSVNIFSGSSTAISLNFWLRVATMVGISSTLMSMESAIYEGILRL